MAPPYVVSPANSNTLHSVGLLCGRVISPLQRPLPDNTQQSEDYLHVLTPWSRFHLEKLTGFQLIKKFSHFMEPESSLPHLWVFRNKISFHGEELLAPCPTPKLEDHPLSAIRDCLFNIFAATLHIADRSSIHNLRTCHAVVTGTHLSPHT